MADWWTHTHRHTHWFRLSNRTWLTEAPHGHWSGSSRSRKSLPVWMKPSCVLFWELKSVYLGWTSAATFLLLLLLLFHQSLFLPTEPTASLQSTFNGPCGSSCLPIKTTSLPPGLSVYTKQAHPPGCKLNRFVLGVGEGGWGWVRMWLAGCQTSVRRWFGWCRRWWSELKKLCFAAPRHLFSLSFSFLFSLLHFFLFSSPPIPPPASPQPSSLH